MSGRLAVLLLSAALLGGERVDFRRDVEPVLRRRCVACHGAARREGGLRLDSREHALEGGYSGKVITAGNAAESKLIKLVSAAKGMPPGGPRLDAASIGTLRRWIDEGAEWPEEPRREPGPARPPHWAFTPVRGQPPAAKGHPVDAFVNGRLEKEGIRPAPLADWPVLVRRLSFDLRGLPPDPWELERAGDWNRLVDRLLASPRFGEKWARWWLDAARYADSDGYEQDAPRPHAWRYRDWVIQAFNSNMPFDRFTIEQIAGDLLPGATIAQRAATGFHRNTLTSREGGIDVEELRTNQVLDRTATVASVWLGLTFDCARCHDHKYDPITQRDYYRLSAFFNSADEVNHSDPLPGEQEQYLRRRPEYERKFADLLARYKVAELQPKWEDEVRAAMADPLARLEWTQVLDYVRVYADDGHEILRTPAGRRTPRQAHDLHRVFLKYPGPLASWPEAKGVRFSEGFRELEELDAAYPGMSEVPAIAERTVPRKTHILLRGDFRSPGVEVTAGTPEALPPLRTDGRPTRLELARWLVAPDNPLTARVFVNRVWQELFGTGLVPTPEDFGTRGAQPSHPELLDYLADRFRRSGWDVKGLIRHIVQSEAYRRSSKSTPGDAPHLYSRQRRLRLPAEAVRDAALSAAGLLDARVGGPSVRPPMPAGMLKFAYRANWRESAGADRYRRGLYTFFQRSVPHPQLMNFDAPNSLVSCVRRERSVTPLQALNLLNDPVFVEAADALAGRILREEAGAGFEEGVKRMFRLAVSREPNKTEMAALRRYADGAVRAEAATWQGIASIVLNLDEFITRE